MKRKFFFFFYDRALLYIYIYNASILDLFSNRSYCTGQCKEPADPVRITADCSYICGYDLCSSYGCLWNELSGLSVRECLKLQLGRYFIKYLVCGYILLFPVICQAQEATAQIRYISHTFYLLLVNDSLKKPWMSIT